MNEFSFDLIAGDHPLALFLDIDGTVVEFAASPDLVLVPPDLIPTLQRLDEESAGGFALITGRPIESADRLFDPVRFPIAGLHGGEFRFDGINETLPLPTAPESWRVAARDLASCHPGVKYEEKRFGFGVHYRDAPEAEPDIMAGLEAIVQRDNPGFHLLYANKAIEIRPDGIDKGSAIRRFMSHGDFKGRHPVFFGDDTTDDDGFRMMKQMGGTPVVVGERRPPEAEFYVRNPTAMRKLLAGLSLRV